MRQVNPGDVYYVTTHEIKGQDRDAPSTWTVQLMHRNRGWTEAYFQRDTEYRRPYRDHAIWARTGYPSEESAVNAGRSQAVVLGLGGDISVGEPEDTREPVEPGQR